MDHELTRVLDIFYGICLRGIILLGGGNTFDVACFNKGIKDFTTNVLFEPSDV